MKLKFIFNTVRLGAAPKADFGADPKPAALAILRAVAAAFALILAFAVACNSRALAQQPDSPSASKSDSAPQPDAATTPDPPSPDSTEAMFPPFKDSRFWLSGQANFIFQTHPPFHADYSGANSLSPNYQKATSRVLTLYTGARLNNSTELLVDIEEAGGSALSLGLGAILVRRYALQHRRALA